MWRDVKDILFGLGMVVGMLLIYVVLWASAVSLMIALVYWMLRAMGVFA